TLASLAGPQVSPAFAELSVRSGLDLVVHLGRCEGQRRVVDICRVTDVGGAELLVSPGPVTKAA
ncbi:MAG: hypothetical protein KGP01_07045, partial [Actinomycetales bacterium]|nr:hypothetical protein [Actinomycetales bacterium]